MKEPAIRLAGVERTYPADVPVPALRGITLEVPAGSAAAVVGPSGSGKSTLLRICGALDRPTGGTVHVLGHDLTTADDATLTRFRRHRVGFVFQFFELLPTSSALENVMLPARLARERPAEARRRALSLLERVELTRRADHLPHQLSGGERQRVAVARALVMGPELILADEPTGNLDGASGAAVLELLLGVTRGEGRTLVVVTHDDRIAARCDQVVRLSDGGLVG